MRPAGSGKNISDAKCWVDGCSVRAKEKMLCGRHVRLAKEGKLSVPASLGVVLNPPCSFSGCRNLMSSRKSGLCHSHNDQLRLGKELRELREYGKYVKGEHVCAVGSCNKPAVSQGFCSKHLRAHKNYSLSADELDALSGVKECENPGCSSTKNLHIDHDHETGVVRGMLCSACNTSLGRLIEDIDRIRGLAEYKVMHS